IPYVGLVAEKISGVSQKSRDRSDSAKDALAELFGRRDYMMMISLAFAVGALASWLRVPTGAMIGAMFAGGGMALFLGKQYEFDDRLRTAAMIGFGIVTGERITPQVIEQLITLFVPTMIMTLVMLVGCILLALLLYKTSEWDLATCLLCAAPAGMAQIVSFAEEVGVDPIVATVFHTARIVAIATLYPWLVLPLI
ncbi:MAG: AbrB family transcriptional regulator, partial [Syntrophorhabdaceae bacterium]|nr:AbrB family transcriptional regulator [Syntrophorhabdaceae bacterium]